MDTQAHRQDMETVISKVQPKASPKLFAIFSPTAWNFNAKFHTLMITVYIGT